MLDADRTAKHDSSCFFSVNTFWSWVRKKYGQRSTRNGISRMPWSTWYVFIAIELNIFKWEDKGSFRKIGFKVSFYRTLSFSYLRAVYNVTIIIMMPSVVNLERKCEGDKSSCNPGCPETPCLITWHSSFCAFCLLLAFGYWLQMRNKRWSNG